jgi:hypothetical protein
MPLRTPGDIMHPTRCTLVSLLAALCFIAPAFAASLEQFSPQGEQLSVRQAQARFSAAMTAIGRQRRAGAVRYRVRRGGAWLLGGRAHLGVRPGQRTAGRHGLPLQAQARPENAGWRSRRPRCRRSLRHCRAAHPGKSAQTRFQHRRGAGLRPRALNGPVRSGQSRFTCSLRSARHPRTDPGATPEWRRTQPRPAPIERPDSRAGRRHEADLELLRCQRTLPANAKVTLVWGANIATPNGQRNPADQRLEFNVRDHFVARLRCQRENAKAGCLPLTPLRLDFTAPVARGIYSIRSNSETTRVKPIHKKNPNRRSETDASLTFAWSFSGQSRFEPDPAEKAGRRQKPQAGERGALSDAFSDCGNPAAGQVCRWIRHHRTRCR